MLLNVRWTVILNRECECTTGKKRKGIYSGNSIFLRRSSEFAFFDPDRHFFWGKNAERIRKGKILHSHVWFHTSTIPDAFEILTFLTRKFNFISLCNLFLAYFNVLENRVAPFQLIRVIPKWLFARRKIRVNGMKCMSDEEPRQQNIMN